MLRQLWSPSLDFSISTTHFHTINNFSPMVVSFSSVLLLPFPSITITTTNMGSVFLMSLLPIMVKIESYFSSLMVCDTHSAWKSLLLDVLAIHNLQLLIACDARSLPPLLLDGTPNLSHSHYLWVDRLVLTWIKSIYLLHLFSPCCCFVLLLLKHGPCFMISWIQILGSIFTLFMTSYALFGKLQIR